MFAKFTKNAKDAMEEAQSEAERMFAEMTNEIPVVEGVEWENERLDAVMPFVADSRNVSELGDHNATAQRIFDRVGWQ